MVCKDARTVMHHVLDQPDGNLDEEVTQHLRTCPSCDQHMHMLVNTIYTLEKLEWLEAPDSISAYVIEQISGNPAHRFMFWQFYRLRKVMLAAVCVCLAFIGGVWWAEPGQFSVVSASPNAKLSITHNQVIVPTGIVYRGNLTISNGDVIVHGKVDGDVTALNGHVILTSGADIKGHTEEVHEFWQLVKYFADKMWNTIIKWF